MEIYSFQIKLIPAPVLTKKLSNQGQVQIKPNLNLANFLNKISPQALLNDEHESAATEASWSSPF